MMVNVAAPDMALYDSARAADPFNLDCYFRNEDPVMTQPPGVLVDRLAGAVRAPGTAISGERAEALAALRDLDFLVSAAHIGHPFAYKSVAGLEPLLKRLGRVAGHIPRGSNITYTLCNPTDARMRIFTGLPEERMFVRELAVGLHRLDDVLSALGVIAKGPVDSPAAAAAAKSLRPSWDPMIGAVVTMLRRMPPEIFSGRIVTCFVPLDIAGNRYQGVTGAQNVNVGIDYLLWGVESHDADYLAYAATNLEEQLPQHRGIVTAALRHTGGMSLLTHIERQLSANSVQDRHNAEIVLNHVEILLRRISAFRSAHRRLADINLPLRESPTGSGGHTVDILDKLAVSTKDARYRAHSIRESWRGESERCGARRVECPR
jgi:Monodechloroaminopyrrolnitrin synthase PrnB